MKCMHVWYIQFHWSFVDVITLDVINVISRSITRTPSPKTQWMKEIRQLQDQINSN